VSGWGGHHGECGARAYNGGPGAEPLVRGEPSPPEAESILVIGCPTEPANLPPVRENSMLCYSPLVSELGGRVHGAPQPRHWGACAPQLRRLCVHIIIKQIGVFNMDYMIGVNIGN